MSGYAASWGVPDFGTVVCRDRLKSLLSQCSRDLRLLVAPSGWGKTIAAAQYAESSCLDVLWVDAFGAPFELERFVQCVACSVSQRDDTEIADADGLMRLLAARGQGTAVVLDDAMLDADAVLQLATLQRRMSVARSQLIVTSRSVDGSRRPSPGVSTLGIADLRLTEAETHQLRILLGAEAPDDDAEAVMTYCDGHVALCAVMTGSAALGIEPSSSRRVESWVRRLIQTEFCATEVKVLERAALLRHGRLAWLSGGGLGEVDMLDIAIRFPLFRIVREAHGMRFVVHDTAVDVLLDCLGSEDVSTLETQLDWALELLTETSDWNRAAELLLRFGDWPRRVAWLSGAGGDIVETVQAADIIQLLEAVPLHVVMGEPRLVALWARCEYSVGDNAAAISRAKAALHLAEYSGDHDALAASRSVWIDALCRIQRYEEAASIVRQIPIQGSVDAQVASLLISGTVLMYVGQLEEARSPLARAAALAGRGICGSQESLRLAHTSCLLEMLVTGSWARFVGDVSAMLPDAQPWPSDSLRMKGNLAIGLLELGRVERAGALLTSVTEFASDELAATYMTFLGCVLVAQGECDRGLRSAGRALELGYMLGLEADAAMNRVYLATLLRACGDTTAALGHAERAYERLCVVNYQGCRPLATVEVAASLLSLDDEAGARRWLESLLESGITQNHYHALRAAMVLAECDRRDGELQRGIDRLAEHRDHILSESSNWQIAMYVRAFPGLLGMFASALGSDALPVHMLRMVLPEYAENALQMCRAWLDHREWTALGVRLLGEAEFARAEQRGEERPCRVRLFGGLSVVVADRTIAERDWKKSKARLLFAMLVSKRGQEVPREQVLDYLWPDLPEDRAKNNFYVAWSSMKRALMGIVDRTEACPYLENKGGRLRIVSDTVRSDIDDFEDMLAEAREAEASDDHRRALEAYGRLSTIYRGDLLPGDLYDDWFSGLRDRCRFDFVDAMVRAVEILLEQDEPCEALAYARRAQQVDPIREDLYQVVMRCSIAAGQRNAAIDAFLQLRARLSDDLGLDPSAESMALYQQILVMENRPRYDDYGLS